MVKCATTTPDQAERWSLFQTSPDTENYYVTFLRHAESVGNASGYWQGQNDYELSAHGIQQSRELAERWLAEKKTFDLVIASPLLRARQTAEIIAGPLSVSLEFDADWMERNNGKLAGLTQEEARAFYPEPPFIHPYMPIGVTGESQWELYLRAGRAIQKLLQYPPGSYLVVSHGGILNMAFYAILGIPIQGNFQGPRFHLRNTGFAHLIYLPREHKWHVFSLNDTFHLADDDG
jgi:2,3-bisphosphoglycerate-dependent phosphoglycerate mutase